jgi:hypothetical protein
VMTAILPSSFLDIVFSFVLSCDEPKMCWA